MFIAHKFIAHKFTLKFFLTPFFPPSVTFFIISDSRLFLYFDLIRDNTLLRRIPFCIGYKYNLTCLFVVFFFHVKTNID